MRFYGELQVFVELPFACGVTCGYLLLMIGLQRFMARREPCCFPRAKVVYNSCQIAVCSLIVGRLLPSFCSWSLVDSRFEESPTVELWFFVYYLSKALDYLDTLFIVLEKRSRQFTLLHLWHHATMMPLVSLWLARGYGAGSASLLGMLNALVHVVMYTHYLVMSLVKIKHAWWKPWITRVQLGQHTALFVAMAWKSLVSPEWPLWMTMLSMVWGISIMALFMDFHVRQLESGARGKARTLEAGAHPAQKKAA